jgi:formate dehydrogenase major subunit
MQLLEDHRRDELGRWRTSSYLEAEHADLIVLWGSNVAPGCTSVDPRRTSTAQWVDAWLNLDVGTDIALTNAVGREIIASELQNQRFIDQATTGFDD